MQFSIGYAVWHPVNHKATDPPYYLEKITKARLENQIAIVTGSSSGNGRAIALALSSEGATVVCADLSKNARKEGYEEDIEIDTDDVIQRRGGKPFTSKPTFDAPQKSKT